MSDGEGMPHMHGGAFSKKVGPLPVWAWGLIVGALIVAYMWYRNRSSASNGVASTLAGTTDPYGNAGLYTGNDANAANANLATASTSKAIRTNAAWVRQAIQYMTGKGRNPLAVQRALTAYLAGRTLTEKQDKIVSEVLTHVGTPPKLPKTVSNVEHNKPQDVTRPNNSNPHTHVPTNEKDVTPHGGATAIPAHTETTAIGGDSPATVAQKQYGTATPFHVARIAQANGVGTTQEFVPGQIVRVPV